MKVILLLAVSVVVCYGQTPTPCASPRQWQGGRMVFDSSKSFYERADFFYDEIMRRTRTIEKIDNGKERDFFDILRLHNENKEYTVNLRTKKCNVTGISFPWRAVGVPPDAKFIFEAEIGAAGIPAEHLTAVIFGGNFTQDHVSYTTTVTFPDCVPIGDNYYNDVTGFIETRYFGITLGISDPEVFFPPSICT
ncbi:mammalian ependymin-related protein 1-like [Dreissena polymorpha]|uniref:Uncharacterized protein n=1 Tax=Dreissena polymorpha TaxID=45954 RepID=A0A9D4KUQ6_DREPO|nr:mammalian ependymin-related protein 1-like [Dreissena polymorpha]KAH3845973.1 hypothetical protein DPMN_088268 [Dreissena polymorpha]